MNARTFIITASAIAALVAPAAHAATATNALHCSLQSTRVATAYSTSLGFRALHSAGKSQKPIGNRCTSKSSKTVVASKRQQPVHKPLIPVAPAAATVAAPIPSLPAAPATAPVATSVPSCESVDDGGYLCSEAGYTT